MATHPFASSRIATVQNLDDHNLLLARPQGILCQDDLPVQGKVSACRPCMQVRLMHTGNCMAVERAGERGLSFWQKGF